MPLYPLGRLFAKVALPPRAAEELAPLAQRGSIVYVMRSSGWLNTWFVRWFAARLALPAVRAIVGLAGLVWPGLLHREPGRVAALTEAVARRGSGLVFLRRPSVLRAKGVTASDPIPALIEIQRRLNHPIYLVPVLFVWSRRAQRLKPSLADLLFGSSEAPGMIATLLGFLVGHRRAFARVGRAIDLAAFLAEQAGAADVVAARKVRGVLYYHLTRETRAVLGPPFKDPARVRDEVLRDRTLQEAITEIARERGQPVAATAREAAALVREIAARMSPVMFEILRPPVGWICNRLYQGMEVDEDGLAQTRSAIARGPVVLCPSHKSHMDYVVLTYLFYIRGLLPPHVAAGINLSFWPFGSIARRCGGFFIRRQFKGDRLYSATLRAYVKRLIRDGFPQEFFIEGGRSRTGKLLSPKTGLLAMEIDACLDGTGSELAGPDLTFVPVAIDYERLAEGGSYARELGGAEKKKEDLAALVKARKVLRTPHGRIYIQFGTPFSLGEALHERGGSPLEGDARRAFVARVAHRIAYGISRANTVTAVGLVAMALLCGDRGGVGSEWIARRVDLLRFIAEREGARMSATLAGASSDPRGPGSVREALRMLEAAGLVSTLSDAGGDGGSGGTFVAVEERRPELDFYRNNVIQRYVALGIVAVSLGAVVRAEGTAAPLAQVRRGTAWVSRLLKLEFTYRTGAAFDAIFDETLALMQAVSLCARADDVIRVGRESDGLAFLAELTRPYLEGYRSAAATLQEFSGGDGQAFVAAALERARADRAAGVISLPESASKATLENALRWLVAEGAFEHAEDGGTGGGAGTGAGRRANGHAGADGLRVSPAWRRKRAGDLVLAIDEYLAGGGRP